MLFVFAVALVAVLGLSAGQASANHVRCGDTITQDTTLDSNVSCPDTGAAKVGLTIGADNITLDLNGYGVGGSCDDFDTAIVNQGHPGVTIGRCSRGRKLDASGCSREQVRLARWVAGPRLHARSAQPQCETDQHPADDLHRRLDQDRATA